MGAASDVMPLTEIADAVFTSQETAR